MCACIGTCGGVGLNNSVAVGCEDDERVGVRWDVERIKVYMVRWMESGSGRGAGDSARGWAENGAAGR